MVIRVAHVDGFARVVNVADVVLDGHDVAGVIIDRVDGIACEPYTLRFDGNVVLGAGARVFDAGSGLDMRSLEVYALRRRLEELTARTSWL